MTGGIGTFSDRIRKLGDPILHRPSPPISDFSSTSLAAERSELHMALKGFQEEKGFGRAIAAPQYGFATQMIAFNLRRFSDETLHALSPLIQAVEPFLLGPEPLDGDGNAFVRRCTTDDSLLVFYTSPSPGSAPASITFTMHNPVVHPSTASGEVLLWDDCFSFPEILVRVVRWRHVSVTFLLADGVTSVTLRDLPTSLAELVQHEVDHVVGKTSFERVPSRQHVLDFCQRRGISVSDSDDLFERNFVYRSQFVQNKDQLNRLVDYPFL